jgi:hypothetical protein
MSRFSQEFYEIAANEVAQHKVVRGIMAKAFSDASGDEKKAIAYYIERRAAMLAQEAKEELRQKRRATTNASKQRARSVFRQFSYGALSGLLALTSLISGLLAIVFVLGGIVAPLGQSSTDEAPPVALIIIFSMGAIALGLVAIVCGLLTYKGIRTGLRK